MSCSAPSAGSFTAKNGRRIAFPRPLAKFGAWLQNLLPGADPFIKPWMIDIADDHYALDISRARDASRLGASPFPARNIAEHAQRAEV